MYELTERTYVNADSTKVVPEGHVDAAFLLGPAGGKISMETAERLGLVGAKADAEAEAPAYAKMKKAEIVALATERGVDSEGTIADIAARLEEDDAKAKEAEVGAGGADGEGGTADVGSPEGTTSVANPDGTTSTEAPAPANG